MLASKVKLELSKKTNDELKKYQFIGAEIKKSRLKLSKTLESISNVSKSVSYISKVENNKIIPNQECLMELCDELLINKSSLDSMNNFDDALLQALKAVYLNDIKQMTMLYEEYKNFNNIRNELMNGLYYFITNDITKLCQVVSELSKIESSLSIDDYLVYVLLSIKELLFKKEVLQVYRIIEVIEESYAAKSFILKIFQKIKFDVLLGFGIYSCDLHCMNVIDIHLQSFNIEEVRRIKYKHLEKKIEVANRSNLYIILNEIDEVNLKFYIFCKLNELTLATDLVNECSKIEYLIEYYYLKKDISKINEYILNAQLSEELLIIANYYKLKLENDDEKIREFIINVCLPYFIKICKINIVLKLFDDLTLINSRCSKYKEIATVSMQISNLLQEVFAISI